MDPQERSVTDLLPEKGVDRETRNQEGSVVQVTEAVQYLRHHRWRREEVEEREEEEEEGRK